MSASQEKQQGIDTTWREVAERLGDGWLWTRCRRPEDDPDSRWSWLNGPDGLCLAIHSNHRRWEIHESLDTLVPETGDRIIVRYLYSPSQPPPVGTITVAHDRPSAAIAREIERRILPSARESLSHLNARKRDDAALHARRQHAFDAILRLVPSTYRCPAYSQEAPRLFLGPTVSLDLRIDDIDSITITQWYGLDLNTVLKLIETAVAGGAP